MAKINWSSDDKCTNCSGTGFSEITTWEDGSDGYSVVGQKFRAVCNCIEIIAFDDSNNTKQ